MRPVLSPILVALLLAMCGLCGVQWWRESLLREAAVTLRTDLGQMTAERDHLTERIKSADAEILRLTSAFTQLRASSVPREDHEAALEAIELLYCQMHHQNSIIEGQNAAVRAQGVSLRSTNETIRKLVAERDELVRRSNEIAAKYNALLKRP